MDPLIPNNNVTPGEIPLPPVVPTTEPESEDSLVKLIDAKVAEDKKLHSVPPSIYDSGNLRDTTIKPPSPPVPPAKITPGTVTEVNYSVDQNESTNLAHLIPTIHTLKTDMGSALTNNTGNVARLAVQDAAKTKDETSATLARISKALVIFLILSFVAGGIGTVSYVFIISRDPQTAGRTLEQGPIPLITANTQTELDVTGADQGATRDLFKKLVAERTGLLRDRSIEKINISQKITEGEVVYIIEVPGPSVVRLAAGESTDSLTPYLQDDSFFGLHNQTVTSGFWIFKTNFFQDVFSEMLSWEESMPQDIYPLLSGDDVPEELEKARWEDLVVQNTDLRVLRDNNGEIRMIYSFMGTTDTLFIGLNLEAFLEVFGRLKNPGPAIR